MRLLAVSVTGVESSGFSLVEVLVALTVFSIGLLGLAGLQSVSVMSTNRAYLHSQAILIAQDMMDRMRSNRDQVVENKYAISTDQFPLTNFNCNFNCTPSQLALFDVAQWKCSLGLFDEAAFCKSEGIEGMLPNGDGEILIDQNQVIVLVYWNNGSGERRSINLTMQL